MAKEPADLKSLDAPLPDAPSVIIPGSTSGTHGRGRYFHYSGNTLVARRVDVTKRYKAQKYDADGNGYTADVVDLAYPGGKEPFVTACDIAESPGDGAFIPD